MRRSTVAFIVLLIGVFLLNGLAAVAQEETALVNKQTLLDAVAAYNAGNLDGFYNMLAEPFMMNQGEPTLSETTRADVGGFDQALVTAIPDIQMTPDVIIAQGDWVATQVTYSGTFTEPYHFEPFGPDSFPPTNAPVSWTEMDFLRFDSDGLVSEVWAMSDPTVMFGQLGVFLTQEGEVTGSPLETPAGFQALSADELAATFTSGMETRNIGTVESLLDEDMMTSTASYYESPYFSHDGGIVSEVNPNEAEPDPIQFAVASALPDLSREFSVVVAEGDWVAYLIKLNGTFTGDVDMGPDMTLTPTGESITWQVSFIDRFDADGLIAEQWFMIDPTPLLQGLGVMPPMDASE